MTANSRELLSLLHGEQPDGSTVHITDYDDGNDIKLDDGDDSDITDDEIDD